MKTLTERLAAFQKHLANAKAESDEIKARCGNSATTILILSHLEKCSLSEGVSIREICNTTGLHWNVAQRSLQSLERRGLVEKMNKGFALTAPGRVLLNEIRAQF